MSLTRLLIRDFRNIETADLALSPGFNFLVGANGSGKDVYKRQGYDSVIIAHDVPVALCGGCAVLIRPTKRKKAVN